jgi:hypothetical protein
MPCLCEIGIFEPLFATVEAYKVVRHLGVSFLYLLPGENVEFDAGGNLGIVVSCRHRIIAYTCRARSPRID